MEAGADTTANFLVQWLDEMFSCLSSRSSNIVKDNIGVFQEHCRSKILMSHDTTVPMSAKLVQDYTTLINDLIYEQGFHASARGTELTAEDKELVQIVKDMLATCLTMLQYCYMNRQHDKHPLFLTADEFHRSYCSDVITSSKGKHAFFCYPKNETEFQRLVAFRNYVSAYLSIPRETDANEISFKRRDLVVAGTLSHHCYYQTHKAKVWCIMGGNQSPFISRCEFIHENEVRLRDMANDVFLDLLERV